MATALSASLTLSVSFYLQQVSATDPDEGAAGDVKYSIIGSDIENTFRLDANSGILYPGASLLGLNGENLKAFSFPSMHLGVWFRFVCA